MTIGEGETREGETREGETREGEAPAEPPVPYRRRGSPGREASERSVTRPPDAVTRTVNNARSRDTSRVRNTIVIRRRGGAPYPPASVSAMRRAGRQSRRPLHRSRWQHKCVADPYQ